MILEIKEISNYTHLRANFSVYIKSFFMYSKYMETSVNAIFRALIDNALCWYYSFATYSKISPTFLSKFKILKFCRLSSSQIWPFG